MGVARAEIAAVEQKVLFAEFALAGEHAKIAVIAHSTPLAAPGAELLHWQSNRHAGPAILAVRPIDVLATAPKTVPGQQRVDAGVLGKLRIHEQRGRVVTRQVAAIVGRCGKQEQPLRFDADRHGMLNRAPPSSTLGAPRQRRSRCMKSRRGISVAPNRFKWSLGSWQSMSS